MIWRTACRRPPARKRKDRRRNIVAGMKWKRELGHGGRQSRATRVWSAVRPALSPPPSALTSLSAAAYAGLVRARAELGTAFGRAGRRGDVGPAGAYVAVRTPPAASSLVCILWGFEPVQEANPVPRTRRRSRVRGAARPGCRPTAGPRCWHSTPGP